jgi:hypothetical protein
MSTRTDERISGQLSIRYCLHGGPATRLGPIMLTMERHEGADKDDGAETASLMLCSELTREQAGSLKSHIEHALMAWDQRVLDEACGHAERA